MSQAVQQIVAESGGSFQKLEPVMQAIVQAASTWLVKACPHVRANSAPVLQLLPVVPLLTAQAYSLLFQQLLTGKRAWGSAQKLRNTQATAPCHCRVWMALQYHRRSALQPCWLCSMEFQSV